MSWKQSGLAPRLQTTNKKPARSHSRPKHTWKVVQHALKLLVFSYWLAFERSNLVALPALCNHTSTMQPLSSAKKTPNRCHWSNRPHLRTEKTKLHAHTWHISWPLAEPVVPGWKQSKSENQFWNLFMPWISAPNSTSPRATTKSRRQHPTQTHQAMPKQ